MWRRSPTSPVCEPTSSSSVESANQPATSAAESAALVRSRRPGGISARSWTSSAKHAAIADVSCAAIAATSRKPTEPGTLPPPRSHRRPVRADLGPVRAHLGGVEAHRDDRVGTLGLGLLDHPLHHVVATVDERLRHPFQLAAEDRLEARAELRADVARADREAHHLAQHLDDLLAGQLVGGRDQHQITSLASRCRTSQARRTSSSFVRRLPTASRRTYRPASFVWERKSSPVRLTRSSSASFASSEPW